MDSTVEQLSVGVIENFLREWYKTSRSSKEGSKVVTLNDAEKNFLTKWFTELHMKIQKKTPLHVLAGTGSWETVSINSKLTIPYCNLKTSKDNDVQLMSIAYVEGDFMRATDILTELVKTSTKGGISLLIADAPYGVTDENWDEAWTIDHFRGTLAVVEHCNKITNPSNPWDGVVVVWFVSDSQLAFISRLVEEYELNFRHKVWVKPSSVHSQGSRLRQDHEHIVLIWKGGEDRLCKYWDKDDPHR